MRREGGGAYPSCIALSLDEAAGEGVIDLCADKQTLTGKEVRSTNYDELMSGRDRRPARMAGKSALAEMRRGQLGMQKRRSHQISKVKECVEEKAAIPPVQQRLIFGGKAM